MTLLKFSPFDTLFFREARPMESVGGKPLEGRFPPTARSISGAVRSAVGEALGVDWQAYRQGDPSQQHVRDVIGSADALDAGALELNGPFPLLREGRLYPVPLHLLYSKNEDRYVNLRPSDTAVKCDLGKVYLPELTESLPGAKPLEFCWLSKDDLELVLLGKSPKNIVTQNDLFIPEGRLGIAIDPNTRSAQNGKLYQTVHSRTQEEVQIGVEVQGLPIELSAEMQQIIRLGGEGRFASVESAQKPASLTISSANNPAGIFLMLCTAADFSGEWVPPGFKKQIDSNGVTMWGGVIEGVALTIRCAVIGKAQREGGWDLLRHCSRPAVSLIPAGSVYFCEVQDDPLQVAQHLNGLKIGNETRLGRGELAIGFW